MLEDRPWNSSGTRCCSVRVDGVYALHASKRRGGHDESPRHHVLIATTTAVAFAQSIDLSKYSIVDLTHAYGPSTVFWPTSPTRFELERLAGGKTEGADRARHRFAAGAVVYGRNP